MLPKIREVDNAMRAELSRQDQVVEVHPEVSFGVWAGFPMRQKKKSLGGRVEREQLIDTVWPGIRLQAKGTLPSNAYGIDDLNDAFAALWTARRIMEGAAVEISDACEVDGRNLKMEIWA